MTRRKLALAAEELMRTEDTVLEVALKYGYDSHEGFTRSFKAYLGVTPAEFRKYHPSVCFPGVRKEKSAMLYSKTADEIIRKLNRLIVEAGETAAYIRKHREDGGEETASYGVFWEYVAGRVDSLASAMGVAGEEKETDGGRVAVLLGEVYSEITEEAERLGVYGGAIQYIAEEIKRPLKYISE